MSILAAQQPPVDEDDRQWVDQTLDWLRGRLGDGPLAAKVIVPTDEFFPHPAPRSGQDLRQLVDRLCTFVGVDASSVVVAPLNDFSDDEVFPRPAGDRDVKLTGHYRTAIGETFIDTGLLTMPPLRLVATVVHELCHERLPESDAPVSFDDEETVDLLAVYLGFGVFLANAAFEHVKRGYRTSFSMTTSRHGSLSEEIYGYALARYALLRGETRQSWSRFLDTNPRTYMKRALRYLADGN